MQSYIFYIAADGIILLNNPNTIGRFLINYVKSKQNTIY